MSDLDLPMAPGLDPNVTERTVVVEADTRHIGRMKHEAKIHSFTFYSDEPARLSGDNEHPYPLDYFTSAIGM
jgi:hypothetical protein